MATTPTFSSENSMDRGAWWATAYEAAKSQTWLSTAHTHIHSSVLVVWNPDYTENHLGSLKNSMSHWHANPKIHMKIQGKHSWKRGQKVGKLILLGFKICSIWIYQLIFHKRANTIQWRESSFFFSTNSAGTVGCLHKKRMKFFTWYTKIN